MVLEWARGWLPGQGKGRASCGAPVPFRGRSPLVLLLAISLAALAPLAGASPPDPGWLAGIYDGGDHDEEVIEAACLTGVAERLLILENTAAPAARYQSAEPTTISVTPPATLQTRAPPTLR